MTDSSTFRRSFPLEAISALSMTGLGLGNIFGAASALHAVIAVYLFAGGLFLTAIAVRRRRGPPHELPDGTNGLVKAVEKLAEARPFGFTALAIAPLPLGFGKLGILVGLMLYLAGVNAMRLSDEELMSWIGGDASSVLNSPRGSTLKKE